MPNKKLFWLRSFVSAVLLRSMVFSNILKSVWWPLKREYINSGVTIVVYRAHSFRDGRKSLNVSVQNVKKRKIIGESRFVCAVQIWSRLEAPEPLPVFHWFYKTLWSAGSHSGFTLGKHMAASPLVLGSSVWRTPWWYLLALVGLKIATPLAKSDLRDVNSL